MDLDILCLMNDVWTWLTAGKLRMVAGSSQPSLIIICSNASKGQLVVSLAISEFAKTDT